MSRAKAPGVLEAIPTFLPQHSQRHLGWRAAVVAHCQSAAHHCVTVMQAVMPCVPREHGLRCCPPSGRCTLAQVSGTRHNLTGDARLCFPETTYFLEQPVSCYFSFYPPSCFEGPSVPTFPGIGVTVPTGGGANSRTLRLCCGPVPFLLGLLGLEPRASAPPQPLSALVELCQLKSVHWEEQLVLGIMLVTRNINYSVFSAAGA